MKKNTTPASRLSTMPAKKTVREVYDTIIAKMKQANPCLWIFLCGDDSNWIIQAEHPETGRKVARMVEKKAKIKSGSIKVFEIEYRTGADDVGGIYG